MHDDQRVKKSKELRCPRKIKVNRPRGEGRKKISRGSDTEGQEEGGWSPTLGQR